MFRLLRIQYPDGNASIYLTVSSIIDRVKDEISRNKGIMLCVENTNQNRKQRSNVDLTPFILLYTRTNMAHPS